MTNNVVPFARPAMTKETNPFETKAVATALTALSPKEGGTISDVQATAEMCLSILADFTKREAEEGLEGDPEYSQMMHELACKLRIASELLEAAPFLEVDFDEEAV